MRQERIFLYGPPGVGKSTLGRQLAAHLEASFLDLDTVIAGRAGMRIPEIFQELGEDVFRRMESEALARAVQGNSAVIALGGGALLQPENRRLAQSTGRVVCLMAGMETLQARVGAESTGRPLLDDSPEGALESLYLSRQAHYECFADRLSVDGLTPEDVLWDLQRLLGRFRIIGMGPGYDVLVERDLLKKLPSAVSDRGLSGPYFLVMDHHLAGLYSSQLIALMGKAGFAASQFVFPAGEGSKKIATVQQIWKGMVNQGVDRDSTCLAFGGGVTGDLAGFAAATFMRGISWVNVPSSLLAMVDSSLGGKTGVDLPQGKNLVGAFNAPGLVLTDPALLATLPEEEFRNGMAEVVKHGLIADPALLDLCRRGRDVREVLSELIPRAICVKARVISTDPFEQGHRKVLNFGHTIGHAVEKAMGYSLTHGQAVAIGMSVETWLAERIGLAEEGLSDAVAAILRRYDLPVSLPAGLPVADLMEGMQVDKKRRRGRILFSLPEAVGKIRVGVHIEELSALLAERMA